MEQIIVQVLYCIGVAAMVAIGALLGTVIFFCLFGYTCMYSRDVKDAWKSLLKARVK